MNSIHKTVLLNETIEDLNLPKKPIVIDGTFGGGGHSVEICKRYPGATIIAYDMDKGAWERAKDKFSKLDCTVKFRNENFRNISGENIDGVILDLGLSSDQLDNSGRGFSFMKDEPLLMTMKENPSSDDVTAYDVVNTWGEENLANIIYGFGEERYSRRIAKMIVDARQKAEIKNTFDLVKIISDAVPAVYRRGKIHFATRTFQAIRMAVNDELGALEEGLEKSFKVLKKGGRISVISFHSLEDRVVKNFCKKKEKEDLAKIINKKIITASIEELKNNPRSRSAKLRILEKK
ncbi:16S rRNA (cytosine(1402)-N(4))-methyltransferase RsmH [Candidatus Nomurabacteria bacterium]|nr:16S rRNA (cytosine(1402)-N(4))-methyltransferase RsmH [Candidatus Nomurabacteria bacterium]